jgi:hypothetical protein
MTTHAPVPLVRVWAVAVAVLLATALASRGLTRLTTPWPAYGVGLIGLLAVGVALVLSWRGVGAPGAHSAGVRRAIRGALLVGALLWLVAMIFPFL